STIISGQELDLRRFGHAAPNHILALASEQELDDYTFRRSEEHTSELQSQSNLVCRLLLEKKKKNHIFNKLLNTTNPTTPLTIAYFHLDKHVDPNLYALTNNPSHQLTRPTTATLDIILKYD